MSFPHENPQLPDDINNHHLNPLLDFLLMAGTLLLAVVVLSFLIGWGAERLAPSIPFNWEPDIVLASAEYDTDTDQKIATYLQTVMERLTPEDSQAPQVEVHWLPNIDEANAFATSGRNVHVTRGLLNAVSSENGLAMVLAHEYAHVELRHPVILMLEQLGHTLIALVTGYGDSAAGTLSQQTGILSLMAFSRDMEREADERAIELLITSYGHTEGADELFQHILTTEKQDYLSSSWGLWQSHPATEERIKFLKSKQEDQKKSGNATTALRPLPGWLTQALKRDP